MKSKLEEQVRRLEQDLQKKKQLLHQEVKKQKSIELTEQKKLRSKRITKHGLMIEDVGLAEVPDHLLVEILVSAKNLFDQKIGDI